MWPEIWRESLTR